MKSSNPSALAMKILDKEIELESDCNISTLKALVDLYREAIEYYEEIKSPKFFDFQERLQKILMKPAVLKIMQEENIRYKNTEEVPNARIRGKTHTGTSGPVRKYQRAHTEPEYPVDKKLPIEAPSPEKNVSRIVETQKKRTENVSSRAVTDIKSQELSLSERLANRRQKPLNITANCSYLNLSHCAGLTASLPQSPTNESKNESFFFEFESDKSAGSNNFSKIYEKIEKIMEDSFNEKSEKITEIRVKYGTQISELEAEGGFFNEIVKEMNNQMKREIEEAKKILDEKRKQLIRAAKAEIM